MKSVRVGDVAEVIMGQAPPGESYNDDGTGLPLVAGASDLGQVSPHPTRFTTSPSKTSEPGDIILCVRATIGDLNWSDREYCLGRGVAGLRPVNGRVTAAYLWHYLANNAGNLAALGRGATFKQITRRDIEDFEIPLPSLDQQTRIAAILDQADELRRSRERVIERLNDLGESIFYEMFGDPIRNERGWEIASLEDFGTVNRGVSKHRPRNDPALLGGEHPLIQTGDVAQAQDYIRRFKTTYSETGLRQSKKWPKGTLCITIAANIADTAILDFDACFPDSVVGFLSEDQDVVLFIHNWFKRVRTSIEAVAPTVAQKNINLQILRSLRVISPPQDVIFEFAARVRAIELARSHQRESDEQLTALFLSLQQRAFAGEL